MIKTKEYLNGTIVKEIIPLTIEHEEAIPKPTIQEQIDEIKLTLDLLLFKQEGIL